MHKLLARQIQRILGSDALPHDEASWRAFLAKVDQAYEQSDADRKLVERSLDLASREMLEANAALRREASLLSATLEATGDAIAVMDKDANITAFNEHFLEMWGYTRDFVERASAAERLAAAADLFRDPAWAVGRFAEILRSEGTTRDLLTLADGRVIACETRPQRPEGGRGRVWSFRDITAKHRAEEALRASEARARSLIENVSDVITITNGDGHYQFVSASVARILGYAPEELVGRQILEFVHPDDVPSLADGFARLAATGDAVRTEFRYRHKDGGWRILESLRVDARHEPGVAGFLGVARDVTEKRRLESEATMHREAAWRRERLTALGTLVAGVAHEINNPLTYIVGNLEMAELTLAEMPDDENVLELRKQIRTALDGSERIARIAKSLKTVSKQEPVVSRERVGLAAIVRNVAQLTQTGIPDHVELVLGESDPACVFGDAAQLHQVVLNLAKNAIEALGEHEGKVSLAVRRTAGHAEVLIEDNGPGIDANVQARLFTPFFTTKPQGTGLGLSIVHSIVKAHGGDVLLDSTPGRGSTFTIRLPLAA